MLVTKVNATSPYQAVSILWEVDGCSGCTTTAAWRIQHELDKLTTAGYQIVGIELHHHTM